ncbi:MAG: hypothetical protein K5837_04935 [Candidatus Saccharibacteria bacterium]|nr:hypothetical protein [Candidatus Saccharibacteria bacterium]
MIRIETFAAAILTLVLGVTLVFFVANGLSPHLIIETAAFTPPVAEEEVYVDPETGEEEIGRVIASRGNSSRLAYGSNRSGIGVCNITNGCRLIAPFGFRNLDTKYIRELEIELAKNGITAKIMKYDNRFAGWPIEISSDSEVSNEDISVIAYNVAARMMGASPYTKTTAE